MKTVCINIQVLFAFLIVEGTVFSESISEISQNIERITKEIEGLPKRPIYPVGGTSGYRFSSETEPVGSPCWFEIHFPIPEFIDSIFFVPMATFSQTQVRAYCLPAEMTVSILGEEEVIFKGGLKEALYENAPPLNITVKDLESPIRGIRIETSGRINSDPYLAFSEIFILNRGRNVALGSNVIGSSQKSPPVFNFFQRGEFVIDGQSSLGMPVIPEAEPNIKKDRHWFEVTSKKNQKSHIDFMFDQPQVLHELRLFPLYAPTNEMWLTSYGHGFPRSFKLQLLNAERGVIETIHQGEFINPHRNMVSFYMKQMEASGARLVIDEFYKDSYVNRSFLGLEEIQIYNLDHQNIAPMANISIFGLNESSDPKLRGWKGKLVDGLTSRGKIVKLEAWLEGLYRSSLHSKDLKKLTEKRSGMYKVRSQWQYVISVGLCLLLTVIAIIWVRSRIRQQKAMFRMKQDIANDLHDDIGSNLASIGLIAYDLDHSKTSETIREIVEDSKEALRTMVWALGPKPIPLIAKLREAASRLLSEASYDFKVENPKVWNEMGLQQRQDVLFWVKEALNNIHKHSQAKTVAIELEGPSKSGLLSIAISDDGCGMNLEKYRDDREHLSRLRARALKLSGEFELASSMGKGCHVILTFNPNLRS